MCVGDHLLIGASLSEPHTSELCAAITVYIYIYIYTYVFRIYEYSNSAYHCNITLVPHQTAHRMRMNRRTIISHQLMASASNTYSMQEESDSTNSSDSKRKRRNQRDRARRTSETAAQIEEQLRKCRVRDRAASHLHIELTPSLFHEKTQ